MNRENLKQKVVVWKVRISYAGAIVSMFGLPYLVAVQMQEQLLKIGIAIPFWTIMTVGFLGLLVLGWLYDVSGFMSYENGYAFKRNSEWQEKFKK